MCYSRVPNKIPEKIEYLIYYYFNMIDSKKDSLLGCIDSEKNKGIQNLIKIISDNNEQRIIQSFLTYLYSNQTIELK